MQSNLVGVAGTSRIGNAVTEDTGTDLEGRIGGVIARTLDGDHFKGPKGYGVEGIEVIIPNDVSGQILGRYVSSMVSRRQYPRNRGPDR